MGITRQQGYNIPLSGKMVQELIYDYYVVELPITVIGINYNIHKTTVHKTLKRYSMPVRRELRKQKALNSGLIFCVGCIKWRHPDEFNKSNCSLGGNSGRCRKCTHNKNNMSRKRALMYLGNKCSSCEKENLPMCCFQFHHRNPEEKEHTPSHYARLKDWALVKKELDKCDLVCNLCHAIIHHGSLKATEVL